MRQSVIAVLAFVLFLPWGYCRGQDCPELQKLPLDEEALTSFLNNRDAAQLKPDCTVYALFKLGDVHFNGGAITEGPTTASVIELLLEYLDYRRPPLEFGPLGVARNTVLYPAASALVSIGKAASPALLKALKSETASDIARDNALDAFMTIHRTNHVAAVAVLKAEVKREQDVAAAERLRKALKQAVGMCYQNVRPECEKAAAN